MLDLLYIARFDYLAQNPVHGERAGHRHGFVPVADARAPALNRVRRRNRFIEKLQSRAALKRP